MDHANEAARSNNASLQSARKQVAGAETQVSLADAQVKAAHAQVQQVQEAVQQAELNLSYTKIVSPTDGQVAQRTVESGNRVQPGQALMAISEPDVWVAYVARRDALLTPDRWDMKGERGQSNRTGSSAVVGKASRLTPPTWIGSAVWIRKGNSSRDQIHKSRQRRTECGFPIPGKMGNPAGHLGACTSPGDRPDLKQLHEKTFEDECAKELRWRLWKWDKKLSLCGMSRVLKWANTGQ